MWKKDTDLNDINADVVDTSIDLFHDEFGRGVVDGSDAKGVLGRQGCCGCHRIALVNGNDLLVGFESTIPALVMEYANRDTCEKTDAPPELSEPAMTSIRLLFIALEVHYHRIRSILIQRSFARTGKEG